MTKIGKGPSHGIAAMAAAVMSIGMVSSGAASAADWPARPISVIVPYTAGGSVDSSTRMVMEGVSAAIGQTIVVENKPGANTTVGTGQLARARPDGYTFGIVPATYTANYALFDNLPYRHEDFAPISHIVNIPMFLFTRAETPVENVKELETFAKSKPANYASTGPGSTGHFLGALFSQTTKIGAQHVPYNGSAPILADLMAGQIDFIFDPAMVPMPHVKAGKLKALAVSLPERCECFPDIPTMEEAGYPGFVQSSWIGLMAPKGVPKDVVDRMAREIAAVVAKPDVQQKLQTMGMSVVGSTPEQFQQVIERDTAVYGKIAQDANISLR